jgi:transposase
MPRTLPIELRERVVQAYFDGLDDVRGISETFRVSTRTVRRWLQKLRFAGHVMPSENRGRRQAILTDEEMEYLEDYLELRPDTFLQELQRVVENLFAKHISISALCETLQRHDISRKILDRRAMEANEQQRSDFRQMVTQWPAQSIVWIDEVGKNDWSTQRQYGYSRVGA